MEILKQISDIGIVPVIKINDAKKARPLAKALIDGGLPIAEVTFRTSAAEDAIREISSAFPDMLVGAGTVLSVEQAQRAKNAGAKFIVSPGFNPKVVSWCLENDILPTPGCTTPSEIEQAIELGLNVVKFFPAEQSGGLEKIQALSAPYGGIKFIPTGGIGFNNLADYILNKKILACGGSFMVKEEYIDNDMWGEITKLTKKSIDVMLGMKIGHIGINSQDAAAAKTTAELFSSITGNAIERESDKGMFVGGDFEIMKFMGVGKCGHIALTVNSVDRAVYHLSRRSMAFDESTATFDGDGTRKFIYLKDEIGGFGVHLLQRK